MHQVNRAIKSFPIFYSRCYIIDLGRYSKAQGSMWKDVFSDSEARSNAKKPASSASSYNYVRTASCRITLASNPVERHKLN